LIHAQRVSANFRTSFLFLFKLFLFPFSLGQNSARLRRILPSLRPPPRKTQRDALDSEIIETISEFIHYHFQTSPDKKHIMKRAVAKSCFEYAPKMFRFESCDELWQAFCRYDPLTAPKISSAVSSDICPRAFRENVPWNLVTKGGESCLCQLCEDIEKIRKALSFISACTTQIEKEDKKKRLNKENRRRKRAMEDEANDGREDEEDEGDDDEDSDGDSDGGGEEEDSDGDSDGDDEEEV
jgi:hypothetical protein